MKTGFWGSILVVATLGLGVASVASAEPAAAKAAKGAAPKGDKDTKAPAKDDNVKDLPAAVAESKPEPPAAPAPAPQSATTTEPAERKVSPFGPPSSGPKVSPFGAPSPTPQEPPSAEETSPAAPPFYGYPPPGYGYPSPGYGYPPPMGEGRPCCPFHPHGGWDGEQRNPAEMPGFHAHDGFFLRLGLGGGYARTAISTENGKLSYSGASMPFNLAMGTAIRPNLILFGELMSSQVDSPSAKYSGESQTIHSMNLILQGIGPGLAYYFMPANIYLSGSILFHKVTFTTDDDEFDSTDMSTMGMAINLMAGKEWWVSRDWGIGLAAQLMMGTAKSRYKRTENTGDMASDGFVDGRWNSVAAGLLMSATYN